MLPPAVIYHQSGNSSRDVTVTLSIYRRCCYSSKSHPLRDKPVKVANEVFDNLKEDEQTDDVINGLNTDEDTSCISSRKQDWLSNWDVTKTYRQHIEQPLFGGIIRPCKSPWASSVVLVRKKNRKLRLCVDYRMLNERTVKDSFALPRMEEIFDCLYGAT